MSGTEPPQIPKTENPPWYQRVELKNAFDPIDTTLAHDAAGRYRHAEQKWREGLDTFQQRLIKSIAEAWEGEAAEAAKKSIVHYATDADHLTDSFNTLNKLVSDTAQSSSDTKKAVDQIADNPRWWNHNAWPFFRSRFENERDEHIAAAQDKMRDSYIAQFATADRSIPLLGRPIDIANPIDIPQTSGYGPGGSRSQAEGTGTHGTGSTGPGAATDSRGRQEDSPGTKNEQSVSPTAVNPTQAQSSSDATKTAPTGTSQTTPAGTTAQPTSPNSPTLSPASPSPGSATPGARTGVPSVNPRSTTGFTPGSPGTSGRPQPPRTPTGIPAQQPQAGKPTMAPAAQARPGQSGAPGGMAPGAAQGKGEDGKEHKTPDYLKNMDNTRELLGAEPRTLPGGVLGGDHDQ
ncbi:hypothetical protein [Nocardia panacis]|uniref:hypothetical protein n=1 Tax=Nocardia panacis TaxID=2340916 RepID=UPI0011C38439|nr:hypothetical protein [Nocardia panacis]